MSRESFRKNKHKSPKFKELNDESLLWEEKQELKKSRKKKKPRNQRREKEY